MIEFVTIFLSLTVGLQRVEVVPSPEVAEVEIRLDGHSVARLGGPPWQAEVDFGPPMPHRLEAVALDAKGAENGRVQQIVNLPRVRAEARLVLAKEEGAFRSVRLIWQTAERFELTGLRVTFDGVPLAVSDPARILLPEHDPETVHYLVAELTFEDGMSAEVATAFGAPFGDRVVSQLTAVALTVPDDSSLDPAEVESWLRVASGPARVVAVESPRAEVVMVRDRASRKHLVRLVRAFVAAPGTQRALATRASERVLGPEDELYVLSSIPDRAPGGGLRLFSSVRVPANRSIARTLGGWKFAEEEDGREDGEEDFWTAVRVAGLRAAQGTRRVVVAVVDAGSEETLPQGLVETRGYLDALHVPLRLLTPVPEKRLPPAWADAGLVHVHTPPRLVLAIQDLRPLLDAQRIVWLEGLHLPQEIELSSAAPESVAFAGSE